MPAYCKKCNITLCTYVAKKKEEKVEERNKSAIKWKK